MIDSEEFIAFNFQIFSKHDFNLSDELYCGFKVSDLIKDVFCKGGFTTSNLPL